MKPAWPILALVLAAGCVHPPPEPGAAPRPQHRTVRFESNPPGARIFLGYTSEDRKPTAVEYLGQTPCTNRIPCDADGYIEARSAGAGLPHFAPYMAVINAELGTNSRQQVIRGRAYWKHADPIPEVMVFDFTKP